VQRDLTLVCQRAFVTRHVPVISSRKEREEIKKEREKMKPILGKWWFLFFSFLFFFYLWICSWLLPRTGAYLWFITRIRDSRQRWIVREPAERCNRRLITSRDATYLPDKQGERTIFFKKNSQQF
jgi:hypothetical protein